MSNKENNAKPYAIKARRKYDKEHYDKILIRVPKGEHEALKRLAEAHNETLNQYITKAIQQRNKPLL